MKRPKLEKWPKHKMGKFYGYEENEDGSIKIAPALVDMIERVQEEEEAINVMYDTFNRLFIKLVKDAQRKRREFWDRVMDEYGLEGPYQYNFREETISRRQKPDDTEAKNET